MKQNLFILLSLMLSLLITFGCVKNQEQVVNSVQDNRMLIVYYSLTGNTEFVAEHIQFLTGADIHKLELVEPYSVEFEEMIGRARQEMESGNLPELLSGIDNLDDYSVIFIGSPNWFGTISLPVLTFLNTHDLSGKLIVPFITFGRGGLMNTISDLKELYPDANIFEEFGIYRDDVEKSQSDISEWLNRLGIIE